MTPRSLRQAALVLTLLLAGGAKTAAQAPDTTAIRTAAENYIQGWYDADADRMASALHPALVKRLHLTHPASGASWLEEQGKSRLVFSTASGGGSRTPEADRRADIRILDVFRGAAVVRIDAASWVDYLQLVEEGGRWLIVNVLWELNEPQPGTGIG